MIPQLWPHPTPGDHDLNKLESTLPEDAFILICTFLAWLFFKRKFWKMFSIYSFVKLDPPLVAPPLPREPWFEQTWIYTTWGCLNTSLSFSGRIVFEKKIFKELLCILLCKTLIRHCGPTLPPGTMIWTNLNLHYLRMLPHKYQLF